MEQSELINLIKRYQNGTISPEDLRVLIQYCEQPDANQALSDIWDDCVIAAQQDSMDKPTAARLYDQIKSDYRLQPVLRKQKKIFTRSLGVKIALAASVLLVLKFGFDFWKTPDSDPNLVQTSAHTIPILPGTNKGKILLEDGRMLDLEDIKNETTVDFDGFSIYKAADGSLSYVIDPSLQDNKIVYNTIITPKGGEYRLSLPDGTQVWINSSSTLKYPVNFNAKVRNVELTGEAYFEVKKVLDKGKRVPFIVQSGDQKLEVLGTSFNVNTYDEHIKTTLVEGRVKLSFASEKEYLLAPNQQAIYEQNSQDVKITEVDPFYITAWKNGSFAFDQASIYEVMQVIGRWYDVDITYVDKMEGMTFTGTVSRFEEIEKLLKIIEMTGSVHFKIKERRILVMK